MGPDAPEKAVDTAAEVVAEVLPQPERDETARHRVGLLTGRAELDVREATYRKLVAQYGGNRRARRRARAEVRRKKST
jgi:hypothetical protein